MEKTRRLEPVAAGNQLFEAAATALGLGADGAVARRVLFQALAKVGSTPLTVTGDELGAALPDIEMQLRLLAPPEAAAASRRRLVQMLLDHKG